MTVYDKRSYFKPTVLHMEDADFERINDDTNGQLGVWCMRFDIYARSYYDTNGYAPVLDRIAQNHSTAIRRMGISVNALMDYLHRKGTLFVVTTPRGRRYLYPGDMLKTQSKDELIGMAIASEEELEEQRNRMRAQSQRETWAIRKQAKVNAKFAPTRKEPADKLQGGKDESDLVD